MKEEYRNLKDINEDGSSYKLEWSGGSSHYKTIEEAVNAAKSNNAVWFTVTSYWIMDGKVTKGPIVAQIPKPS